MPRARWIVAVAASALTLAACGGGEVADPGTTSPPPRVSSTAPETETVLPEQLAAVTAGWATNFGIRSVDLSELKVGILARDPRDRIPPIDDPRFEDVEAADEWLEAPEPGVLVETEGTARFYPLRILTRHEIVNDTLGERAVVITYCPLCNTALVFDPVVDGRTLRFGVSGLLRNSDLVMWDDATESLWQQITGEAIVGELTGTRLEPISSSLVRWADFASSRPDGEVLSRDTGFAITYGANPYVGYSSRERPFGFYEGEIDDRYPALERVVGVRVGGVDKAYPFPLLAEVGAVNDVVGGDQIVVLWGAPETADALDSYQVAEGRGIGTGVAYRADVDGRTLTFEAVGDDRYVDAETGTTWTLLGEAIDGPLAGSRLEVVPHRNEFWFAWHAFFPDAGVWEG